MSSLARRLLIVAAVEGLLLTPIPANSNSTGNTPPKSRRSTPVPSRATSPSSHQSGTVQIDYKTANIHKLLGTSDEHRRKEREGGLEVHGIAGVLNVSTTTNYLIAITSRQQVAIVNQIPIYVITDVALIPLSSQASAQEAIVKAKASRDRNASDEETETDISDDESEITEDHKEAPPIAAGGIGSARTSTESERPDTVGSKGVYGLFAQKWFSKSGWTAAKPKPGEEEKSVDGPKTSMEVIDDEPGNQDVITVSVPAAEAGRQSTDLQEGTAPPPSPKPENKPAPELESFPALPLSEEEQAEESKIAEQVKEEAVHSLTPKLLHTTRLLLGSSKSFFFSYDMDITRPFSHEQQQVKATEKAGDVPLWTNIDPLYFWNKHLLRPFISSNQHSLILPLMQGFIGQKTFYAQVSSPDASDASEAPPQKQPFILTLISRRSSKRAGLRYLRRGVDSEGNVANCVETEQLLSIPSLPSSPNSTQSLSPNEQPPDQLPWAKVYSLLQIRGSIPIYFQQSPYALRPKPVLLHSENSNKAAFEKHFKNLESRYNGEIFGINLVERGSAEHIVGDKYEKYVEELNRRREEAEPGSRKVGFNWFDFHKVCRGMRFEKVSLLLDEIDDTLNHFSWTEIQPEGSDGKKDLKTHQKGLIRTNCMDCLDRTNVVQSACARRILERQLRTHNIDLTNDPTDWFNLLWADNGDAISKQYASTAALKGDFTRTRKRNYRGALADLGLTINRYFTNIISDFFMQAAVDYLLGNVNSRVWDEFEAEMRSRDPAAEMGGWGADGGGGDRVGGIRANAIDICSKIVIADSDTDSDSDDFDTTLPRKNAQEEKEVLIKGWTFLTPHEENTLRTFPFTESVLLLTNRALYSCRFDFELEKVVSFERVDLRAVRELKVGTYITSTLTPASVDESANVGFMVRYVEGGEVRRVNTRTIRSRVNSTTGKGGEEEGGGRTVGNSVDGKVEDSTVLEEKGEIRVLAFKALPRTSAVYRKDSLVQEKKIKDQITVEAAAAGRLARDRDEKLDIPAKEQIMSVCLKIEAAVFAEMPDGGGYLVKKRLKGKVNDDKASVTGGVAAVPVGIAPAMRGVSDGVKEVEEEGRKGEGKDESVKGVLISEEDIIGLREARLKTGLLEKWGYRVKRLVWA